MAEALIEETDYFVKEAEKAVDLEAFAEDIWPRVKLKDGLKGKLTTVFTERFSSFMPEFVGYYLAQTDKGIEAHAGIEAHDGVGGELERGAGGDYEAQQPYRDREHSDGRAERGGLALRHLPGISLRAAYGTNTTRPGG